jgi:hypothetical protein
VGDPEAAAGARAGGLGAGEPKVAAGIHRGQSFSARGRWEKMKENKKIKKNIPKNMLLCGLCCGISFVSFGFDPQTTDADQTELADAISKIGGGGMLELL